MLKITPYNFVLLMLACVWLQHHYPSLYPYLLKDTNRYHIMPILIYESGKGVFVVRNASIIIPLPFNPNIVLHGSLEYEFIKLKYIMPILIYESPIFRFP